MGLSQKSSTLVIVSVVFPVLASLAVILRLWGRKKRSLSWEGDDYFIILALVRALSLFLFLLKLLRLSQLLRAFPISSQHASAV